MSVVTIDMIEAYAKHFGTSLQDGTQYPGVVGSLRTIESGQGTLVADLMNGNEIFYPLMEAYCKALKIEMPEDWKKPLVKVDEKLPEADKAAE
jgi:hypothetical protein